MFEVALLFERGYLSGRREYVRSGTIFSYRNRGCATVRSKRRKRKERERWQQRGQRVGGRTEEGQTRGLACAACLLFVLSSLLREDVNWTERLKGSRPVGDSHPSNRGVAAVVAVEGCYFLRGT